MKSTTVLLVAGALLALACSRQDALVYPEAPIVLISIDTLRADRLPAYGYGGVETPAIDALWRDAILFERAYTHYPLTLPAHASVLTGLLPTEHGVRDNIGYRLDTAGVPYLPRLLKERGYRTGGAVSAYILRRDTGLGDHFDFYEDSFNLRAGVALGQNQRSGTETARRAIDWLEEVAAGAEPFFLFFHVYEPHTPYSPPEPYASRYRDEPYDGEVAAADAAVGEVIAALKRLGAYERSIIVLFSDHGEGLTDHGELEHGILLYREALEVPLLVKLPGSAQRGTKVAAPAQLADIAPTLMALLGEPTEQTTLLDLMGSAPPRAIYSETYYPRLHLGWSDLASLIEGDLHYIEGPDPELYDLAADREQKTNVLAERRDDYWALRDKLAPLRKELAAPAEVDAETRARLAALGYLGTTAAVGDQPLPDPKSKLPSLADLMAASRLQAQKEYARAIELYRRVIADNPGMVDAWENLAQCLHQLSRYDEAAEAYGKALELSRGADHVALGAARLHLEMERWDDAREHAALALATNPAMAHLTLARIAFQQEDLATAEQEARKSLAARPNAVAPHLVLAQAAVKRGDLEKAAEHVARAEREEAKRQAEEISQGLHFVRGDLEARRGNTAQAEASFLAEIRHYPSDTRAYCSLALLYALDQRPREAVGVLRRMVETNETPAAYAAAVDTLHVFGDPRSAAGLLRHALSRFPDHPKLTPLLEQP